jgi:hypothetical protein
MANVLPPAVVNVCKSYSAKNRIKTIFLNGLLKEWREINKLYHNVNQTQEVKRNIFY